MLAWVAGNHSLRFGGDIQQVRSTFIDLSDVSGTFSFDNAAAFPGKFAESFSTKLSIGINAEEYLSWVLFQDEWRMRSNLVLSYGLRYETETILRDRNNWGPRVSVAYDPLKTGKTVIRFGAGIFYNRALLRTIDDFTLGAQQLFFDTNDLD